jgi:hypothetical protein
MSVADVIRPADEGIEVSEIPNCALINTVTVCDDPNISPDFAAFSFGPYVYINLGLVNLLYFLYVKPI